MVLRKLPGDPPPGTCHYCHQKTGFRSRYHKQCCDPHTQGFQEITQLAAHLPGNRPALLHRRPRRPWKRPHRRNTVRGAHSVTDPDTVDSDLHPALTASPDRMPGEFPVEPQVQGNDSDQVQVGSPSLRKDLFGVPLVFSPDIHSEFGSATETAPGYGSIQSVEIALPHPDGRHGPVHGTSESKYGCVARGQLAVVFNLEVQDRQVLLPGPCLWRHTAHFLQDLWDLNQGPGPQS